MSISFSRRAFVITLSGFSYNHEAELYTVDVIFLKARFLRKVIPKSCWTIRPAIFRWILKQRRQIFSSCLYIYIYSRSRIRIKINQQQNSSIFRFDESPGRNISTSFIELSERKWLSRKNVDRGGAYAHGYAPAHIYIYIWIYVLAIYNIYYTGSPKWF